MARANSRYYLLQFAPGSGQDAPGGAVRIAGRIPPDLAIGETPAELPVAQMVNSLSAGSEPAGVIGELIPAEMPRPDGLSVIAAITLPVGAVIYLLMPGVRADFRDFLLLLAAAPVLLLSGISILSETVRCLRRATLAPVLFHLLGALAAYAYGVALVMGGPAQGEGGRYFLYALTLASLPVLYKLGPSISRSVYFRWIIPTSLPAYLQVESEGAVRSVPTYRVAEGMIIALKAGMTVPVECVAESGEGEADYIGLPDVLHVRPGDIIHAGVRLRKGALRARVVHVPDMRVVEASTRLRTAPDDARPYDMAMNLMSALAVFMAMAAIVFAVRFRGAGWFEGAVTGLVSAGALPLGAVELLGRFADMLLADLAAARGIASGEKSTPARLAAVQTVHLAKGLEPAAPPPGVAVKTEGAARPGEAAVVSSGDEEAGLAKGVLPVHLGARESASREAAVLLTGRTTELFNFLSGAARVRRAEILGCIFSITMGAAAVLLAAVGVVQVYIAIVFGALAALWGEMILASAGDSGR